MAQHVDLLPRFWLCILSVLTILDLGHHFILVTFRGVRWVILNRKLNTAPKFKVSSSNLEWLSCQLLPFNFFSLSRWTLTWHWSLAAWVMATGSCVITLSGRNKQNPISWFGNEPTFGILCTFITILLAACILDSLTTWVLRIAPPTHVASHTHAKRNKPVPKIAFRNVSSTFRLKKTQYLDFLSSQRFLATRNMDSVTAAEWLQCLTSKLRYFFWK